MDNQKTNAMFLLLGLIVPFAVLSGIYTILNGQNSPGGGFQGGALLASAYIIHYMITPVNVFNLKKLQLYEKILLILVIISAVSFFAFRLIDLGPMAKSIYLYLMNIFIGLKVFCGFVVIFERFVFFEVR